jgi:hypothetical protein
MPNVLDLRFLLTFSCLLNGIFSTAQVIKSSNGTLKNELGMIQKEVATD